jgi:uncharacterized protein YwqG
MPTCISIDFVPSNQPLIGLVTKFGGFPVWLEDPEVPLSRRTGDPMTFVGQIVVPPGLRPDEQIYVAYVFMTGAGFDDRAMETWNPEDGETAVILQKGTQSPTMSSTYPQLLKRWEKSDRGRVEVPCEYAVVESPVQEAPYMSFDQLDQLSDDDQMRSFESWRGHKIGGSPYWLQNEEFPFPDSRLLLQLEDGTYPFSLNLGTGVGYVFIDSGCQKGKLLWQC